MGGKEDQGVRETGGHGDSTQLIPTQAKEQTASSPFPPGEENLQEEMTDDSSRGQGHMVILSDWQRQGSANSSPGARCCLWTAREP